MCAPRDNDERDQQHACIAAGDEGPNDPPGRNHDFDVIRFRGTKPHAKVLRKSYAFHDSDVQLAVLHRKKISKPTRYHHRCKSIRHVGQHGFQQRRSDCRNAFLDALCKTHPSQEVATGECCGKANSRSFDSGNLAALPFGAKTPGARRAPDISTITLEISPMNVLLLWIGRLTGLGGVLLSAWAAYNRIAGSYFAGGFQVGTLLLGGMAAMLIGCLCLLVVLTNRPRP